MPPPEDLDGLSNADLKSLVLKLLEEVAALRRTIAAQRDEIARLKGGSGRPNIKPSGMDRATEPKPSLAGGEPRPKGSKASKLSIHEERTVELEAPPQGARFKGYTDYVVQDLMIRPHVVNFRCQRWQMVDGEIMTAPLPTGISGHFGPELRRFVLAQYHQAQVTVPRLLALLRAFGIIISKRQIVRLLIAGQEGFIDEACDVWRAGLSSAKWITVDDTGARHKAANGFCTQIGNVHFAWFGTTGSKNRGNFLNLLRAGHDDYVINAEALAYMRQTCIRGLIWSFYRDLKAYRQNPSRQRKAVLRARFDRIFTRKTGFVTLDRLLTRLHANKRELLMVLDRPEIPLHTNGSENDVRCQVTKRKVSGGTRSDRGRDCRDAFLGLNKTCAKLGIAFWDYLGSRLAVPNQPEVPYLPAIVRTRCVTA